MSGGVPGAAIRVIMGLLVCLALLWPAASANAHAALVSSEPADGSVLPATPQRVVLHFSEPVAPVFARLVDSSGVARTDVSITAHDDVIEVVLPEGLPGGTQTLSYRVISVDSHPVGGAVSFSIGAAGGTPDAGALPNAARNVALWASGYLIALTLLAGVGGAFFMAFNAGPGDLPVAGPVLRGLLLAGGLFVLLSLGVQGLDVNDLPLRDLPSPRVWLDGASGTFGMASLLRAASAGLAIVSLSAGNPLSRRATSLIALALLGAAAASTGHASSAPPQGLTRPAVFVHAACVAIWVGALGPLAALTLGRRAALANCLWRFSRLALVSVPLLLASGVILASVQLTAIADLTATAYGRILSGKLIAVVLLLALAGVNLLILSPGAGRNEPGALRWLSRTILAEMVAVLGIFALASGWRLTPPPRALAIATPAHVETIHMHGEKMMAMLAISPARAGLNRVHIDLLTDELGPLDAKSVTVAIAPENGAIEPRTFAAIVSPDGGFDVKAMFVPVPGAWRLEISADIDDFTRYELSERHEFAK